MNIQFYKYQGTGNDFVLLDNRTKIYDQLLAGQIKQICDRHFGVGADGLMLLNNKADFDFEMVYYNADGNFGSMCGNGGRCMTKFASHIGIKKNKYKFLASDGVHEAEIDLYGKVSLKMQDVDDVDFKIDHYLLNTGSPHYVKFVKNVEEMDVITEGHKIRYSKEFEEKGVNVNFIELISDDEIFVRTYERGVENETLSCGTGVTASALISAHNEKGFNRVEIKTKGGNLNVEFEKVSDTKFTDIWLSGPVNLVFTGEIKI